MNSFSKDIYDKIFIKFLDDLQLKNQIYRLENEVRIIDAVRESKKIVEELNNYLKSLSLYSYFNSYNSIKIIINKLNYYEVLLTNISSDKDLINDELIALFLKMLGFLSVSNAYLLENIININFYLEYIDKTLKLIEQNQYNLNDDEEGLIYFLKRCYYISYHEGNFKPQERVFNIYHNYIIQDLTYLKNKKNIEYYNVFNIYLNILLDHKFYGIYEFDNYIEESKFEENISNIKKITEIELNDNNLLFQYYALLFKIDLYNIKKDLKDKKTIDEKIKKNLIIKCTKLIEIYYKDKSNSQIFFDVNHILYDIELKEALTLFSKQIVKLLNDSDNNVNEILFILFMFLSNFSEYFKLNLNIYNRINFILRKNFNRKIDIVSTILYLKTVKDIEQLKIEILKIKRKIEKSPISSLVYLYNSEIIHFPLLTDGLKSSFKINPIIIEINEKIYSIHKIILENISKFRDNYKTTPDYNIKLEYLMIFYNEMKNIFKIVEDPYLVTDVGKLYGYFIDNYISARNMDYREDYINKSKIIKMSIFDINPMTFAVSLLFSKLGKMSLFLNHKDPKKLSIKKKFLTTSEKEQFTPFVDLSLDYLPKEESGYDWEKVGSIIKEIRSKALSSKSITPPEARIIKVLCAFFNKVTRHEDKTISVFNNLYDESFVKVYNYWDLDPIFIYYLNLYLSKKGKQEFFEEYTGEKFDISFSRINNNVVLDQIYNYVEDLLEYTDLSSNDILGALDGVSKTNKEYLIDEKSVRKKKSVIELSREIKRDTIFIYETIFYDISDKLYLSDIMKNILIISGKSNIINPLIFALEELIEYFQLANMKRVYFEKRNLDIEMKYSIGILNFNDMLKTNYKEYKEIVKTRKSKICVTFQVFGNEFIINVSNDYRLLKEEIKHLNEQIQAGKKSGNLKDILSASDFS
ncbi:MAG TPA: hypothetical protein PK771_08745, partial [Spirochaetota bacterium]|nr:hypothetical protein [Spirochaetota bacterium]